MMEVKKFGFLWIIPLLIAIFLSFPAYAQYSGGSGTAGDPYQIATAEDLMLLGESPDDYDKHFILTVDIDLHPRRTSGKVFDRAVIAPDIDPDIDPQPGQNPDWEFQGLLFTGVFDGNTHVIRNLFIQGAGYLGLFGQLGSGGKIFNLGLEAVDISGSMEYVGGLVGNNSGSITTCYSVGTVTGDESTGGLVGFNDGSIVASYSISPVSGDHDIGGLVGRNSGSIVASYSINPVSGDHDIGGLVGRNGGGNIIMSYGTGPVSGNEYVGGLVGWNYGSIVASYSIGPVSGNQRVGGLVGYDDEGFGITTASFWNTETSGQSSSAGGTGLTTVEMQDKNIFLNAGWDSVDETLNGTSDYWQISDGNYPSLSYLAVASPVMSEGLGTAEQPYLIRDAWDLGTVWLQPAACYRLEASVDLSGVMWSVAVVPWFGGNFDGNGYVINNLHVQGSRFLGLFGELDPGAKIHNLGVEAVDINGMGEYVEGQVEYQLGYVGGLAGFNSEGIITNSHCTGTVCGTFPVGGLVGENHGTITTSYSTCMVNGKGYVGGLVGHNEGSITTSYSNGTTSGDTKVGGLVGENHGTITTSYSTCMVNGDYAVGGLAGRNSFVGPSTITNCYSAGKVTGNSSVGGLVGEESRSTDVTNCFWDKEIVGFVRGISGKPVTTAEMQTARTFLRAGWDFVDETENGTEDIWWIDEGNDYPRLWWEPSYEPSTDDLFFSVVDDFESYNDIAEGEPGSNRIYLTWVDGYDNPEINGSFVSSTGTSLVPMYIIHRGLQSMWYSYDNAVGISEATANTDNLAIGRDWTIEGVVVLSLWFRGFHSNAPEPMYVALNNSVVVINDDPNATQVTKWTEWRISLQEFADQGVDLTNINTITIGFGDKSNSVAGGSGKMWFDDIRLYRPTPEQVP